MTDNLMVSEQTLSAMDRAEQRAKNGEKYIEALRDELDKDRFVAPPKFTDEEAREAFDTAHMAMHRAVNR